MTAVPPDVAADLRLENARLQAELRAAGDRQNATAEILRTIASAPSDAERALHQIAETSARLFGAPSATIHIAEGDGWARTIRFGASSKRVGAGVPDSQLKIGGRNMPGTIVAENRQVNIPDVDNVDPAIADWPGLPHVRAAGTRSMSGSPLRREGNAIGALIVYRDRLAPFTDDEMALQQSFADQAAISIENARLFNETQEALERQTATADILKVIASSPSDVQPVFDAIAESAKRLAGGHNVTVTRVIDEMVHLAAFSAGSEAGTRELKSSFPTPISSQGIHSRVARSGQLAFRTDMETEPDLTPAMKELARARGYRSILVVPMLREGIAIGTIAVTRRDPGLFADNVIDLLRSFADQAVIAIENARLFNETKEALERQTATAEILKVIASSPSDVQPVFEAIVNSAAKLFEPCSATITTLKDDKLHWDATAASISGFDVERTRTIYPIRFDPERVPSARAVLERRIIEIPDIAAPDTPEVTRNAAAFGGFRSITFVPLVDREQGIGTIIFTHPQAGFRFSERQLAIIQTFADQAVIAIQNARLFNETKEALERQTATAEILKVIASSPSDVQPVFEAIADSAKRLIGGFSTTVLRFIGEELHLVAYTPTDPAADEALKTSFPRLLAEFPSFALVRDGATVQFPDTESETVPRANRELGRLRGFRSVLFTPLMSQGTPIGMISVTRAEPGAFVAHHVQLLQTFADQAVIAIENVRLFNETQEALERQTATADILKVIASSPTDVQPVFEAIATSANRLLGGFSTAVFRFVDQTSHLAAFTPTNPAADNVLRTSFPRPVASFEQFTLAQSGQPIQIPDIETLPDSQIRQIAQARGFRGMLFSPLMNKGTSIGLISVTRLEPGAFAPHHVQLLQTFADQAVIAIENVRLFNETKEALERQTATADILKVIASSPDNVQPVFDAIATSSKQLLGGFSATVFRFIDGVVNLAAYTPVNPDADKVLTASFPRPAADLPIFELAKRGEVVQEPDSETNPDAAMRALSRARGFRSSLLSPLMSKGTPIGLIVVTRKEPGTFADHHVQLLQTFADQAVIAIENARLFDEVQAKTRDLSEALTYQTGSGNILRVIASSPTDVKPVLNAIVESACELCEADDALVSLREDNELLFQAQHGSIPVVWVRQPIDAQGVAGLAVMERKPVHVHDLLGLEGEQFPRAREFARTTNVRTVLCVPLLREGESIGVIVLRRTEVRPFTDKQITLLQTFADQAVIAIGNVRLFDEVQAKTRDLTEALTYQTGSSNILKVIASSPTDVEPVLKAIVDSACELCSAYDAIVRLRNGDHLELSAHHGPIPVAAGSLPISPNWTGGLAVIERRPVHIHDLLSSEGDPFPEAQQRAREYGHRTILTVPMLREGESVGVIIIRRNEVAPFSDKQIALLQTFADQAVIAIDNVRLFDEVQEKTRDLSESLQQQTATADVLKVISRSAFDLQTVLDTLVASASELCGADQSMLALLRDGLLKPLSYVGPHPDQFEFRKSLAAAPHRGTMTGRAILDRHVVHVADVLVDPEFTNNAWQQLTGYRAVFAVPLMRQGQPIGAMMLSRKTPGLFADRQIELVQTFADQAVIAIENVRLFDEVQAKTRDLSEALTYQTESANILNVIASSPTDVGPALQVIVESACRLCDAYDAGVLLKVGDDLQFSAHHGPIPIGMDKWPLNRNWVNGRSVIDKVPVHVSDFHGPEGAEFPDGREQSRRMGHRCCLSVPLLREGESIGTIALRRLEPVPFSDKQIALLQTFADQAVIAISNVRLFDEVQAKTGELTEALEYQTATGDVLNVISRSPNNLQPVMDTIVHTTRRLCQSEYALMLRRENDGVYRIAAHSNASPELMEWMQNNPVVAGDGSAVGIVVAEKQTVHLPDALADPRFTDLRRQRHSRARTMLGVPLLLDQNVIGVVFLARTEVKPFSDKQVELVTSFADQAVIAISNVGLFNEVQERTRELSQSLDELRTAQDRLVQTEKLASLGQLTAGIAHEIKNPLNFVNNFAALSAELTDELNGVLKPVTLSDKIREEIDELTGLLKDNLEKVVQHGKRADSIVKNMLLHSREGSGEHRPADINALLDESLNLAYHGARAEKPQFNVTLQRDFDERAGIIEVFPQEITRVFLNLISNGFYAVTKRKTENGSGFEPMLSATTKSLGDTVEIRIRDNGTGIPAEVKEKMFNPFFTTKPAGEGTGLGLSMSHDIIVKQHGGTIDVATEPGQFTEFTVVLPRTSHLQNKKRGQS